MRAFAVSILLIFVAGCVTQTERAAQVQRDVEEMIRVYGPGCEKLGFKTDTDPWRDCVLRLATKASLERRDFTTMNCIGSRGFFHCSTF
jgi:tetrahydromethanopterin S-methyltransferase subunit D